MPRPPFRVFGNTYYVGVGGLSALLVTSDAGHILVDRALPQSATLIDQNIRALGFRTTDIKLIVHGHAHYDHTGAIAAIQRVSGATVAASASGARALQSGEPTPDDPQFAFGRAVNQFPAVKSVKVVADGETLTAGPPAITAHMTPGHTPGSTTWTWRSCEGPRCLDMVYADSLGSVAAPGFRFTGDATHPSIVSTFRQSIAKVAALPCDIIILPHPSNSGLDKKLEKRARGGAADAFVDKEGCRTYAADATRRLNARIADEQKQAQATPATGAATPARAGGGGRRAFDLATPRPIPALDSVWIEELTWMEVRDAMQAGKTTAIIPAGSTEQNGPYVPTGKHVYVLRAMAEATTTTAGKRPTARGPHWVCPGQWTRAFTTTTV